MKCITWNCNGAFRKKHHTLDELSPDLVIIQECENPELSGKLFQDWAKSGDHLWKGDNKNKGIGVFARTGLSLRPLDWPDDWLQSFLPFRVNGHINMVGVWTKENSSPTFKYIGQFWKYLQKNKERLACESVVICGDFNSNKRWDVWDRWWNHSDVVRELEKIGVVSLYHKLHGEPQGEESQPTLYLHRKLTRPYHVDYAFASERLCDGAEISVGQAHQWLEYSDHTPIVFDLPI